MVPYAIQSVRSIFSNIGYQGLTNLVYLCGRVVYLLVFSRLLGAEAYGIYAYAQAWYILALGLANWGLPDLLVTYFYNTPESDRRSLLGRCLSLGLVLQLILTALCCIAAVLFEPDESLVSLILIYALGISARAMANLIGASYLTHARSALWFWLNTLFLLIEITTAISLAYSEASLLDIALAQVTIWWGLLLSVGIIHQIYIGGLRLHFDRRHAKLILRNGAIIAFASLLFGALTMGMMIAGRFLLSDPAQLGLLAICVQVVAVFSHAMRSLSRSLIPLWGQLGSQHSRRRYAARLLDTVICLGLLGTALGTLVFPSALGMLLGESFTQAGQFLADYSWTLLVIAVIYIFQSLLLAQNRTVELLISYIVGWLALVGILLLSLLTYDVTIELLLLGLGLAYLTIAVWQWVRLRQVGLAPPVSWLILVFAVIVIVAQAYFVFSASLAMAVISITLVLSLRSLRAWKHLL